MWSLRVSENLRDKDSNAPEYGMLPRQNHHTTGSLEHENLSSTIGSD